MVDSIGEEFEGPGFDLGRRSSVAKGALDSPVEGGLITLFKSEAWMGMCGAAEDMFTVPGFEDVMACGIGTSSWK